ncbi:hypothetical protein ACWD6P_08740 [Streptomyces sp. NPDC002446]
MSRIEFVRLEEIPAQGPRRQVRVVVGLSVRAAHVPDDLIEFPYDLIQRIEVDPVPLLCH